MESAFEKVLIDALDALEGGEGIGAILARYPEYEAELRPILQTTASLASIRVAHSLEAQAASRQRMLDYAAASATAPNQGSSLLLLLRRFSLAMAALLIVFALLGTGVLFASSEALPGDALYDAKRFFEDARFSLTGDATAREDLQQRFEATRVREIKTLLRMSRSEEVMFTGIIEAINEDTWLVAGMEVVILDTTSITGAEVPAVGYMVQISGVTVDGRVNASTIIIRSVGSVPEPTLEPDSSETATAEPTPTSTATPTPTATATPTAEEATPEATPASTPTLESNENVNNNDDENEAGGNSNENEQESNGNEGGNENESNDNGDDDDDDNNENGRGNSNEDNDNNNDDDSDSDDGENENNANDNGNDNDDRNENDDRDEIHT